MPQNPTLSVEERLAQATCAVMINDQVKGAAWLFSDEGHLLTAGHILGKKAPLDRVKVCFAEDVPRTAHKVLRGYDHGSGVDFAILKLESPPPDRHPLPIELAEECTGNFMLLGYGKSLKDRGTGCGTFTGFFDPQSSSANRLFKLDSKQLGEQGYSGGAVFSKEAQAVVAIQIEATTARTGPERDTVLAMPLYRIDKIWTLPQPKQRGDLAHEHVVRIEHPARIFICYKRNVAPDQKLARYVHKFLTDRGHEVFIDLTLRIGAEWLDQIDRQIKESDFLIVLLSQESVDSEMVQAEVSRAYEYHKSQGKPQTLPVRMTYEGMLPYAIAIFLNPLQYVVWQGKADNERVAQEILAAIEGRLPEREPFQIRPAAKGINFSEDGRIVADREELSPPLPDSDPRFLKELTVPSGAVRLSDKLYVERSADTRLKRQIFRRGSTATIRASRQTGKTSLLIRGIHHAHEQGANVAFLDFQAFGGYQQTSLDDFLRELAGSICDELGLDLDTVEQAWRGSRSATRKLTRFIGKHVLPIFDEQVILAMDEADCLLQTDFHKDFFSLLRSWHNRRASHPDWERLNIVLVISTEPYLLIDDVNQSPFNVGLRLYLKDFDAAQVRDLNQRHGSPVSENDFPHLMALLSGHPYLTRKAFYTLVTEHWTWSHLIHFAATDQGPFGDHLQRQYWLLRDAPDLRNALKEIIHHERCADELAFFRLLRAGLVKGRGDVCRCRCGLYEMYFRDKL